jgi:hypothetical protein
MLSLFVKIGLTGTTYRVDTLSEEPANRRSYLLALGAMGARQAMRNRILGTVAMAIGICSVQVSSARAQSPNEEPPPILQGGIVHQLRSLSEDALNALSGDKNNAAPRPAPVSRRSWLGARRGSQTPQSADRPLPNGTSDSNWVSRSDGNLGPAGQIQGQLSDSQHPTRLRAGQTTTTRYPSIRDDAGSIPHRRVDEIHIEQSLPAAVRQSLSQGFETSSRDDRGSQPNPRRYRSATRDADSESDVPGNGPPRVSRVPLPTTSDDQSGRVDSGQPSSDTSPSQRSPQSQSAEPNKHPVDSGQLPTKSAERPAREGEASVDRNVLDRSAQTTGQVSGRPAGQSVSVPTKLVGRPSVERQRLPELPESQESTVSQYESARPGSTSGTEAKPSSNTPALPTLPRSQPDTMAAEAQAAEIQTPDSQIDEQDAGSEAVEPELPSLNRKPLPTSSQPPSRAADDNRSDHKLADPPSFDADDSEVRPVDGDELKLSSPTIPGEQLPGERDSTPRLPNATSGSTTSSTSIPSNAPASNSIESSSVPQTNSLPDVSADPEVSSDAASRQLDSSRSAGADPDHAATERMRMEAPGISVVLLGPGDLPVGRPADYRLIVENRDSMDLEGLVLRLDLPAGIAIETGEPPSGGIDSESGADGSTLLTWMFEHLAAGQDVELPLTLQAAQARNFGIGLEWTLMPIIGNTEMGVLAPQLEVALEGPSEVLYGEANTYRLHVRNPGNADANAVVITLSAGPYGTSSSEIGTVPAGGSQTVDVELTFNQQGKINISAMAEAPGELSSGTDIEVMVQRPRLAARLDAPPMTFLGSATPYMLTLENTGDASARSVEAVIDLPVGAQLAEVPAEATLREGKLHWPTHELAAGEQQVKRFELTFAHAGENRVNLTCRAEHVSPVDTVSVTQVEAVADLKLEVDAPRAPAPLDSEVTYRLTLTNRGSKAARQVRVITHFSNGIEPVRGEGQTARVSTGQVYFEPIESIAAGESLELQVIAQAETDGNHRFRAEVRSDESEQRLVQEASTRYLDAVRRIAAPIQSGGEETSVIR